MWLLPDVDAGVHVDLAGAPGGLLHAGEGWVGEAHEIPRHRHDGWELYLQLHGRSTWRVAATTVELGPGWLLAVPPDTPHHGRTATRWRGRHQFTYAAVDLGLAARGEVADAWRGRGAGRAPAAWSLAPVFRAVVAETAHDRRYADAGIAAATALLVVQATRLLWTDAGRPADLVRHAAVARARQLLHDEPGHPWTVTELAAACGLSRTRLADLFRAEVGQPPYDYLLTRRVERAAELLSTTPYAVEEIAHQVGFGSRAQLARHFHRLRGTSPRGWRAGAGRPEVAVGHSGTRVLVVE